MPANKRASSALHFAASLATRCAPIMPHGLLIGLTIVIGTAASDDLAARRLQIEKMSPAEQQELLRRQERFATLAPEEQQRLRELQAAIDSDPHAQQLQQVLKNYHEWLKTLSPSQRAELADLGPAERVSQIKRIKQQQDSARQHARQHARQADVLSPKDMQEIVRWTEDILWEHRERFLTEMPQTRREAFEHLEPVKQRHGLLYFAYDRGRRGGSPGTMGLVHQKEIDRLTEKLSPAAKEALTQAAALPAQKRLVVGWIGTAMHRAEPRPSFRKLPPWVDGELVQFFQNDLKPSERDRLLKMPREQMLEELRKMYFDREGIEPGISPAAGSSGRFRGGPPGDRAKGPRSGGRSNSPNEEPPKSEKDSPP